MERLELLQEPQADTLRLSSPSVGTLTCALRQGDVVRGGTVAGVLITLGRARELIVPEGVEGVVRNAPPELVHAPVGYGTALYELGALAASGTKSDAGEARTGASGGALVFRSPSAGRYWHRASPQDPALVAVDQELAAGQAVGVIEVMKTFTLVQYVPQPGLPAQARITRVLVADGAEVSEKQPLFELQSR